jgi:hypothetical protein
MDKALWQNEQGKINRGDAFRLSQRNEHESTSKQMVLCQELHERR